MTATRSRYELNTVVTYKIATPSDGQPNRRVAAGKFSRETHLVLRA